MLTLPSESALAGAFGRRLLLAGSLVAGATLAVATIRYAHPWTAWLATHHCDDGY